MQFTAENINCSKILREVEKFSILFRNMKAFSIFATKPVITSKQSWKMNLPFRICYNFQQWKMLLLNSNIRHISVSSSLLSLLQSTWPLHLKNALCIIKILYNAWFWCIFISGNIKVKYFKMQELYFLEIWRHSPSPHRNPSSHRNIPKWVKLNFRTCEIFILTDIAHFIDYIDTVVLI